MSPKEVQQLCQSLESEPVTSIRLNDKLDYLTFDADTEEVPWHEDGYYLSRRPQFTLDPLFHAGCYYVQEASSMFVGEARGNHVGPRGNLVGHQEQSRGPPGAIRWAPEGNHVGPPWKSRGPPGEITWAPKGNHVGSPRKSRGPPVAKRCHVAAR